MPKTPILSRERFYDTLGDGSHRLLDWCLVNTELGAMIEPRQSFVMGINPITNIDAHDMSYNKSSYFDEGKFFSTFNTGGYIVPKDISSPETYPIKPRKHS